MTLIKQGSCQMCKYFEKMVVSGVPDINAKQPDGFCHRNPPGVTVNGRAIGSYFSPVKNDQWCGEFATKLEI